MIIKCISNTSVVLPNGFTFNFDDNQNCRIKKDNLFIVYAMNIFEDFVWYYINDNCSLYPMAYPALLFNLVDPKISKFWVFNFKNAKNKQSIINFWSFPAWANEPGEFYANLLEDSLETTTIYQKYKTLMDLEYPNPQISLKAKALETNWLMCPICIDAWQTKSLAGMVQCPKCTTIMHNPNYLENILST